MLCGIPIFWARRKVEASSRVVEEASKEQDSARLMELTHELLTFCLRSVISNKRRVMKVGSPDPHA